MLTQKLPQYDYWVRPAGPKPNIRVNFKTLQGDLVSILQTALKIQWVEIKHLDDMSQIGATREMAMTGQNAGLIKCQTAQFHLHEEDLRAFKAWAGSKV